jgi:phosphoribosyl-ATP pyrophosphohydrolase
MPEQETNPFDINSYSNTESELSQTESTQAEQTQEESTQIDTNQVNTEVSNSATELTQEPAQTSQEPTNTESNSEEGKTQTTQKVIFEWENEVAKDIYDNLTNGNISEVADILYEQKVLSELDSMPESDVIKLKIAYDYPELSPEEIEEEFQAKYGVDKNFDDSLMTEDEIASKKRQIEKQEKAIARELKKDVREAKDYLQTLKQDISFPDILSQFQEQSQQPVNTDEVVNQYLKSQEEEQSKAYQQAREMFEKSIDEGLKSFEGFRVNYKDEEVQFDGNYSLSPEEKTQLQNDMKDFDLESFYGPRYYKDGKYDTKQIAEDIYFLQNRDKIVNSMVTQAVSKAKSDLLKGMKNIDYSNTPRTSTMTDMNDYDNMVSKMFSL